MAHGCACIEPEIFASDVQSHLLPSKGFEMPYPTDLLARSKLQPGLLDNHLLQTPLRTVSYSRYRLSVTSSRTPHLGLFINVIRPSKIPLGKQLPVIFVRLGFQSSVIECTWSDDNPIF